MKTLDMSTKQKKSPEQILRKSQQPDRNIVEGGEVAATLRELNITEAILVRWQNHYGGLKTEHTK